MNDPRPYRDAQDLASMRTLLMVGRKSASGSYYVHTGDLNWWLFYAENTGEMLKNIYLWEDHDQIQGWALLSPDWRAFDVFVRPELRGSAQALEMYRWAQERLARLVQPQGAKEINTMWIFESDTVLAGMLKELGFSPGTYSMHYLERPLEKPVSIPALPAGYKVRSMLGEAEAPARAAASHAAFESEWPIDRYVSRYLKFMRTPVYMQDLDVVAVAPGGRHVAFCISWPDPVNKVGLLEPVGAHPDYRNMGLSKAVVLEGLRRLRARGMTRAIVCAESANSAARRLYESAGFGLQNTLRTFVKPVRV